MLHEPAVAAWLTDELQVSAAELAELSGLSDADLRELVDYGVIAPLDPAAPQWWFAASCLPVARSARRLRAGFELESHATALVLSLLARIRGLEGELAALQARMPRRYP